MAQMPPVPQQMGSNGKLLGARQPPSGLSLFCHPACAISGYVTGDPLDGSCEGPACISLALCIFCGCIGSLYAMFAWKPDPAMIKNDGTMRTLNNKCCDVCCLDGPCTIAFWYTGDICGSSNGFCADLCEGEAGISCILNVVGMLIDLPLGDFYACCCWTPNPALFRRNPQMHGSRDAKAGEAIAGAAMGMATAVATAVGIPSNQQ